MRKWLRRLRGGLGIGELWAASGAVTGALAGLVVGLVGGIPLGGIVSAFSLYAGVSGALSDDELGRMESAGVRTEDGSRQFEI